MKRGSLGIVKGLLEIIVWIVLQSLGCMYTYTHIYIYIYMRRVLLGGSQFSNIFHNKENLE